MGIGYKSVVWNKQKKQYDVIILVGVLLYLIVFIGSVYIFQPEITIETLIIRSTGTLALIMLHIILMIGPLSRVSIKFLPLLYNRRHLGVIMFFIAAIHGIFSLIQFHGFGNENPLVSLFTSNAFYSNRMRFPFEVLGFFALIILFLMAATSHDFWLKNLSSKFWKALHMLVYLAYGLLIMHVMLGIVQQEQSIIGVVGLALAMFIIIGLHLYSGFKGQANIEFPKENLDGFYKVGLVNEIKNNHAKLIIVEGEHIAIFKYDGKLSAVNNVCKHQNGPLAEGKIVDSCIVCPWHGYQYKAEDGCSPPPFKEKICTYELKLIGEIVYVNPKPKKEGTFVNPVLIT